MNALQHNIQAKGSNAYYYAHTTSSPTKKVFHNPPQKISVQTEVIERKTFSKPISNYIWYNGSAKRKLCLSFTLPELIAEEELKLDFEENSDFLNVFAKDHELRLGRLYANIDSVRAKVKPNDEGCKIVLFITKTEDSTWHDLLRTA
eukprot:maker-scaffold_1-snap-gene-19.24-mRNA-1 protein AED:0.00 eAED:0.00 QI:153/1/1/1/1/1/2/568/146